MPSIDPKLKAAVTRAAADRNITAREAKSIVNAAKASGSKKPIDDVFVAIKQTNAAIEGDATRYVVANLDQKLSQKDWRAYVQKAASGAGVWGPSHAKILKRADLPPAVGKVYDAWLKARPEDKPEVSSFEVAGKAAFLMSQYSEWGTAFALFDEKGKNIPLKQDTENVERNKSRIQDAYDAVFDAPEMKNWRAAVQHTDIGIVSDYFSVGTHLEGAKAKDALAHADVKAAVDGMKKSLKTEPELYRNKKDGTLLVLAHSKDWDTTKYALLSRTGKLIKEFTVEA